MSMQALRDQRMLSLDDIRDHVTSLFIMLNKKTVILFRIEFLVVLVTLLFFAMFLMDFFRRIIHNSFMRAVFSVFDAVSDSIVVYLLGAMQSAPFKNQLFPVWALVLVNFRYSADYISGYGVPDRRGRRFTEWRNVIKLLGSAFLNWTRGSSFMAPLWYFWCLQIVRSMYRLFSHGLAFKGFWHGRSSELVAEHMRVMHDQDEPIKKEDPMTMKGYRYLVYGETKQNDFKLKKPQYALSTDEQKTSPLITLDKIWEFDKEEKDLPLAFALSRLLRCRLEDVTLEKCIFNINQTLVKSMIDRKVDTSKDALKIMELQLAFVHDYFNTRYPMVFCLGLRSLFVSLLLSVLTIGVVCWLAVDIRKVYKPPSGDLVNLVNGYNVDMIITWLFMCLMVLKEIWEMITYLQSDWTRLITACEYVQRKCNGTSETMLDSILLFFSRNKKIITDRRWHGMIDQYVFVQSYDDRPRFWNLIHNLTTGIIPKKDDGAALSSPFEVKKYVRRAVLDKLKDMIYEDESGAVRLPSVIKTLRDDHSLSKQLQSYQVYTAGPRSTQIVMPGSTNIILPPSTQIVLPTSPDIVLQTSAHIPLPTSTNIVLSTSSCTVAPTSTGIDLPTSSHIILVWHIATSLCEMELATRHGVNLSKPGFPCSLLSWLISCISSKPFLMDVVVDEKKDSKSSCFINCSSPKSNVNLSKELQESYIIANSLSRYCAYLLVSKPDLIPDSFLVPSIVFQKAVKSASNGILKDCDSLLERYNNLNHEAKKPIKIFENEDVLKQGVVLGKELLNHRPDDDEGRWKILADVWTELLIHIAPTWNAQAHKKCLSGGEFITHIWALLWHYGIQESSLWPKDLGPESYGGGNQRRQTDEGDMRSNHIGINADEANDNKGPKEHEAGNSSSELPKMEETEISEIGEFLQDPIVDTAIVQRGMAGQAQQESEIKKVQGILSEKHNLT